MSTAVTRILTLGVTVLAACYGPGGWAANPDVASGHAPSKPSARDASETDPKPDLSGNTREGIASYYAQSFAGREMANGEPMDPEGDNAASRTLPLGTSAKVTNLETGKSAVVRIKDRGPYVKGRIVDLSPATARKIGITRRKGISKVAVAPIAVPQPDGTLKSGDAAGEFPHREAQSRARAKSARPRLAQGESVHGESAHGKSPQAGSIPIRLADGRPVDPIQENQRGPNDSAQAPEGGGGREAGGSPGAPGQLRRQ